MKLLKKYISVLLCTVLVFTAFAGNGILVLASEEPTHTGVVNVNDALNVRNGAGIEYNSLGTLAPGTIVHIYGSAIKGGDYSWYKISYGNGYGYVSSSYIKDIKEYVKYDYNASFEENLTKQGFPESYKTYLRQLHVLHPNWVFVADHLTMTFKEAVDNESLVGKTLVHSGALASWKSMASGAYNWSNGSYASYDSGGWVTAEREVIEYFMEPRNFLNDNYIFLFLEQSYNPSAQNMEGLNKILKGTFMEGKFPESTHETYADVIMEAAEKHNVSPYVLAASIIIEQGSDGGGASISGTEKGYEGYYNFFNVRAYASGSYTAVAYGLKYAMGSGEYGRPWNTRAKSIIGGAEHYADGYVSRGQDTLYYKKYNVIVPSFYAHQYMTNVQGAHQEATSLKKAYSSVDSNTALTFAIPVYKNTTETNNTYLPTSSGANNYYLTSLGVDGASVDNFNLYKNDYEMIVPYSKSSVNITATTPSGASASGTGTRQLSEGMNHLDITVTAASGKKSTYTISVYREASPGTEPDIPVIDGSYNVSTFVSGVKPATDVASFLSNFGVKDGTAKVFNASGQEKTTGNIGTGDKVTVYDTEGKVNITYNIVIYGDTNGDGKISIVDLARVQKHLLELINFENSYEISADVNKDGKVNIVDLARMQKHLLELITIAQ